VRQGEYMWIEMDAFPHLRCKVEKISQSNAGKPVCVKFSYTLDGECRDRMIVKLYTGRYSQDIHELDKSAIAGGVWSRMFGRSPQAA
jgi:cellulose synthase (UDP-forming)